jgi:hypothetical protein
MATQVYSPTILVKRQYSKAEVMQANEAPGKNHGRTAGSWVHDLCALRKVITLCPLCTHKFNPGRLGYIKEKEFPVVQAKCDGCETFDPRCSMYLFEETYKAVRSTASDRRAEQVAYRKKQAKLM